MYLQTPQIPFKGEIIRQFNYRDGDRWKSVLLVKLDNNPVTPFVCWVYDHTQRACFWGHYGSRDFAEAKYHERVRKHNPIRRALASIGL